MPKIEKIYAREILDSRGNPTISTVVFLDDGKYAFSGIASGVSVGVNEAYEMRDRDNFRYNGMGVLKAVDIVNTKIFNLLKGCDIDDPIKLDKKMIELDSSENKENLGANTILSVSIALNKLCAISRKQELYKFINEYYGFSHKVSMPTPFVTAISGGKYSNSNLDFQEFFIIPVNFNSFKEKLRASSETFHALGKILTENKKDLNLAGDGAYSPDFKNIEDVWKFIIDSINKSTYSGKIKLGVDSASSNFFNHHKKKYSIKVNKLELSGLEMINYYLDWVKKYNISYFEDPFDTDDINSWVEFNKMVDILKKDINIIGDDLFTTNVNRLKFGIEKKLANAITIKPNQIGTVSETIDCIKLAQKNGFIVVVSSRGGETCDDFISDLSVGVASEFIKIGAISGGEKICKYNRLLQIEENLF